MSKYSQKLKRQLARYKLERLGVNESGTFRHNGVVRAYGHILPKSLQWLNLLEPIRREVRAYLGYHPEVHLDIGFHHLNSSQAFALNLFFPFFAQGAEDVLLRAMNLPIGCTNWGFEHIADQVEATHVDVKWETKAGVQTFCEVKLSEQEFGKAKDDRRHRQKLADIYRPVLEGVVAPELLEPAKFFAHYQLLRNVWLAARQQADMVVFLVPRANEGLWSQLNQFVNRLSTAMARRVHVVAVEDVFAALAQSSDVPPSLLVYVELLAEKYLLASPEE